jgi:hypothetical protein
MKPHELLRQAALILGAGWSKGCDARDDAGRIVPLHVGDTRAKINPSGKRPRCWSILIPTPVLLPRLVAQLRNVA